MNDTPIIEGEDLLRIYNDIEGYTGRYACLNYDMTAVSPTGEEVHFIRGTLVQIYPYMSDEAVEDDKWNGYMGAYMGQDYKVLHSISIRAYYNNTLEKYVIWTNDRPIRKQLDAHMSCMLGRDFLQNVFRFDRQIDITGKHLDDYLNEYREVGGRLTPADNTKTALKITSKAFGGVMGFVLLGIAFLVIGLSSTVLKMFGCMALFFVICPLGIKHLSQNDRATQAIVEEWGRCNQRCIAKFEIISHLHGGEPLG